MPDLDIPDWLAWIIVAGAGAYALFHLGRLARLVRLHQFAAAWGRMVTRVTRAAFKPLTDAMIEAFHTHLDDQFDRRLERHFDRHLDRRIDQILEEVKPNAGDSLRDAVDRLEARLAGHILEASLDREDLRRWLEHIDPDRNFPRIHRPSDDEPPS